MSFIGVFVLFIFILFFFLLLVRFSDNIDDLMLLELEFYVFGFFFVVINLKGIKKILDDKFYFRVLIFV